MIYRDVFVNPTSLTVLKTSCLWFPFDPDFAYVNSVFSSKALGSGYTILDDTGI